MKGGGELDGGVSEAAVGYVSSKGAITTGLAINLTGDKWRLLGNTAV